MYLIAHATPPRTSVSSLLGCVRDVPRRLAVYNAPVGSELAAAAAAAGDDARIQRAAPHWRVLLTITADAPGLDARALVRLLWARAARTTRARFELGIRLARALALQYTVHEQAVRDILSLSPPPPPPATTTTTLVVCETDVLARGGRADVFIDCSSAAALRKWQPPPPPKRKTNASSQQPTGDALHRAVRRALEPP